MTHAMVGEQMVVAGHHVLGAEVHERTESARLEKGAVGGRHAMRRQRRHRDGQPCGEADERSTQVTQAGHPPEV